jgi:hypothetical protein
LYEGVEVDEAADAFRYPVSDARDHHSGRAGTEQDDLAEVFEGQHVDDVLDVCLQVDPGVHEVRAFAQADECGRMDGVPVGPQQLSEPGPAPSAEPGRMHQHEYRHLHVPSSCGNPHGPYTDGVPPRGRVSMSPRIRIRSAARFARRGPETRDGVVAGRDRADAHRYTHPQA